MKPEHSVLFFWNGTAVFKNGEQVPELQILWMESELKRLAAAGVDLQNADLKISNGTESWTVKPIISEHGISWKVKGEK